MLISECGSDYTIIYLYDAEGEVIGMRYRTSSYATNVWDTYWYEKNIFGDIVAVYSNTGVKLISYKYDAWGNFATTYHNDGATTPAAKSPFTYRGYYYDNDLGLYYLRTRYYDSNTGRFISPDNADLITASPTALTDKNLYAYCDNNPVMRVDEDGEFWITALCKIAIGLAMQYVSDVIENVLDGKTGAEIFVPQSSAGEYVAAGVTALIPGSGVFSAIGRSLVSNTITSIESSMNGKSVNALSFVTDVVIDLACDYVVSLSSDYVSSKVLSLEPRNYSQFAHQAYKNNPYLTSNQIRTALSRTIKTIRGLSSFASGATQVAGSTIIDRIRSGIYE